MPCFIKNAPDLHLGMSRAYTSPQYRTDQSFSGKTAIMKKYVLFFVLLLAVTGGGGMQNARATSASPDAYRVQEIKVDVQAENAVKAREKAFAAALQQGFARLVEQVIADPAARVQIRTPDIGALGRMLQDFSTAHEQLGGKRYAASYDLRFKPAAVNAYLTSSGVDPAAPHDPAASLVASGTVTPTMTSVLVIPFYQDQGAPVLWATTNPLRDALQGQPMRDPRIKLTLGDLEDVQIFDEARGLTYAPDQMRALLQKYAADMALIAVAIPDRRGNMGLSVMTYRADRGSSGKPVYLDTLSFPAVTGEAMGMMYARSAAELNKRAAHLAGPVVVPQNNTATTASTPDPTSSGAPTPLATPTPAVLEVQSVELRAHFDDLNEWQQIRARLNAVSNVQSVRVIALKAQEARVELRYVGTESTLVQNLEAQSFETSLGHAASYPPTVEPGAGGGVDSVAVYDIHLIPSPGADHAATQGSTGVLRFGM